MLFTPGAHNARFKHTTQTKKQPTVFRCKNPSCNDDTKTRWFDFTSDYPECPKCKSTYPVVIKRALIHLLIESEKGKIVGAYNRRYSLACDSTRDYLATETNGEAATGDPAQVNCPGCMKVVERQIKDGTLFGMKIDIEEMKRGR